MKVIEPTDEKLNAAIILKKKEMIEYAKYYGMTDSRTVICSQQLDRLLNQQDKTSLSLTG
ncbi:aspartyl-phosphate phosphatase Spo0E family protein [Oceanobacillus manasiensis]|uniref:aspartyl-phosphate phosphatase Spo0E family protein n=1 Tax=Oceanobacillus manasiensis TaxID=586413 RepID=UPI0005A83FF1|nr:aspartyl-phosphate phosphatase Spo0E family protein [Oceanobacillus manasiensis]